MTLAPEAEEVLVVDGVEEDRRHGLHGQAVDLRRQPEALDGGAAADVPGRVGPRAR